jgi:hypothetical protein
MEQRGGRGSSGEEVLVLAMLRKDWNDQGIDGKETT